MMGLFTAIRFDRPVPIQASSLARLSTLLTSSVGRAFLETYQPISDVSASKRHSPCDEEVSSLASPSGTNENGSMLRSLATPVPLFFRRTIRALCFWSQHLLA